MNCVKLHLVGNISKGISFYKITAYLYYIISVPVTVSACYFRCQHTRFSKMS